MGGCRIFVKRLTLPPHLWGGKSGQHREPHFPKGKAHSTECDRTVPQRFKPPMAFGHRQG